MRSCMKIKILKKRKKMRILKMDEKGKFREKRKTVGK